MIVKLNNINGTYYLLLKKEVKEMMKLGDFVDVSIENGKILIEKAEDKAVDEFLHKV